MVFLSPDFAKLRFRKTLRQEKGSFALNGSLYKLFFAVEENRSVAQIAAELDIRLADARQGLERLCSLGMIAPLSDQGPYLSADTLAQIQHHFGRAMGGRTGAADAMRQVIRQLSEDGRHINLAQARTFLNHLCDRIQHGEARQRFRSQVVGLLKRQPAGSTPGAAKPPHPPGAESRGRTRAIINAIITARSQGKSNHVVRIKNAFRRYGIEPDRYRADTRDDPKVVARLERMARKAGIHLPSREMAAQAGNGHRSAGELKRILDAIILQRHGDTPDLARSLRSRLRLKGIHPGSLNQGKPVEASTVEDIHRLARHLGIEVRPTAPMTPSTRGRIKTILDRILHQHSTEGPGRARALRTKLLLRGIDPETFSERTPDDPAVLRQVQEIAHRLGLGR